MRNSLIVLALLALGPGVAAAQPSAGFELAAGPTAVLGTDPSAGGELHASLYRHHANMERPSECRGLEGGALALITLGIVCTTPNAWAGNERGLELRLAATDDLALAGLGALFRIAKEGKLLRFPAVLGALLPELGVARILGGPTRPYVRIYRIPITAWVRPHLGVELEMSLFMVPRIRPASTGDQDDLISFRFDLTVVSTTVEHPR